jgi:hypothetical protein
VQIRVTFRFPTGNEVRYLERLPMQGGTVRSHGARFCVAEIEKDPAGGYSVTLIETMRRRTRERKAGNGQRPSVASVGRPGPAYRLREEGADGSRRRSCVRRGRR